MFIEELWYNNPDLVIKEVKKICRISKEMGYCLNFIGIEDGFLNFKQYGHLSTFIKVSDFSIRTTYSGVNYQTSPLSVEWMKFMHKVFGDKYLYHYIAYRNNKLDKFMAEYEDNYNNETRKVLAELGLDKYKDELNQSK